MILAELQHGALQQISQPCELHSSEGECLQLVPKTWIYVASVNKKLGFALLIINQKAQYFPLIQEIYVQ
ncbi:MAG: hypothetical protein UX04_C0010G0013 [Microgenomates group bacterium GW2011_GWF2_45_18]|nr:MAG: hypothetical protein UW18_C0013G0002 [Microgenomates group bacterium GW2011_GWF1_44_10]KKU01360.1 MAG: hypothetical protein UX04_C0010G0013 [Microgenomates group bacterium GW2011_GWF2_45_18]HAU99363.1 hypothetical protein [Candidatus Paceibacterota bacterium]HAX01341.1 hypothetical protein [Candidatus Paceibacterota bacterium]